MVWGTGLWDVHPNLHRQLEINVTFLERFFKFTKTRIKIEKDYAANLKKLIQDYIPKQSNNAPSYTHVKAFEKFLNESTGLANQHELIAEKLDTDIMKTAKPCIKKFTDELNLFKKELAQLESKLAQEERKFQNTKNKYKVAHEEVLKAKEAKERADNDRELSRIEVDRFKSAHETKRSAFESIKQDYASVNQAMNRKRQDHFHKELPAVLFKYEDLEKRRIEMTVQLIRTSAEAEKSVMHIIKVCQDDMIKAADSVTAEKDLETLANNLKTDSKPPGDEEFLELDADRAINANSAGGSNQSLTGSGGKGGGTMSRKGGFFGWRTPEKADQNGKLKVKLRQQIKDKEGQIEKETKAVEGIKRMVQMYQENPKFGDPNIAKAQLRDANGKLQALQQECHALKEHLEHVRHQGVHGNSNHTSSESPRTNMSRSRSVNSLHDGQHRRGPSAAKKIAQIFRHGSPNTSTTTQHIPFSELSALEGGAPDGGVNNSSTRGSQPPKTAPQQTAVAQPPAEQPSPNPVALRPSRSVDDDFDDEFDEEFDTPQPSPSPTSNVSAPGLLPSPDLSANDGRVYCRANYQFDKADQESLGMEAGEWFYVIQYDSGDGWTKVARYTDTSDEGFVPTNYVELHGAVQQ